MKLVAAHQYFFFKILLKRAIQKIDYKFFQNSQTEIGFFDINKFY